MTVQLSFLSLSPRRGQILRHDFCAFEMTTMERGRPRPRNGEGGEAKRHRHKRTKNATAAVTTHVEYIYSSRCRCRGGLHATDRPTVGLDLGGRGEVILASLCECSVPAAPPSVKGVVIPNGRGEGMRRERAYWGRGLASKTERGSCILSLFLFLLSLQPRDGFFYRIAITIYYLITK